MPAPTNSEKIEELREVMFELQMTVAKQDSGLRAVRKNVAAHRTELVKEIELLRTRDAEQTAKLAAYEERIKALEKHSDRTWQVWLALIGSLLAVVVAFVKK